jgi:hypothetical protein
MRSNADTLANAVCASTQGALASEGKKEQDGEIIRSRSPSTISQG